MLVTISDLTSYMDIRFSLRQQDAAEMVLAGLQSELEAYLRRPIEVDTFVEEVTLPVNHVGMPTDSFFYNTSVDTSMKPLTYSQPSPTIYLRNSPVIKVHSVQIRNTSTAGTFYGEGVDREATVTGATQTGTNVTFTASGHGFTKGQTVLTLGLVPDTFNIQNKEITAVTTNTFTIGGVEESLGSFVSGGTAKATGHDYVVRRYGIDIFRGFANDIFEITYDAGLNGSEIAIFKLLILRAATREMQNMHDDVVGIKDLESRNVAPLETGFSDRELMSIKRYRRVRVS